MVDASCTGACRQGLEHQRVASDSGPLLANGSSNDGREFAPSRRIRTMADHNDAVAKAHEKIAEAKAKLVAALATDIERRVLTAIARTSREITTHAIALAREEHGADVAMALAKMLEDRAQAAEARAIEALQPKPPADPNTN